MPHKQEDIRRAVRECSEAHAEQERKLGRIPNSREIERKWQNVARDKDRKDQEHT